jgi:hypothetical protein
VPESALTSRAATVGERQKVRALPLLLGDDHLPDLVKTLVGSRVGAVVSANLDTDFDGSFVRRQRRTFAL